MSKRPGLSGSTTRAASTRREEGMFALCFSLSYYDFYHDTVDVILFITPTVSKSAIV